MSRSVVVIGAGIAGCAAAVAAARAGARVRLVERTRQLGGVAVAAGHRHICGLAPLDAPTAELLEPELVGDWLARVATGAAERRGRVWLWPCTPESWQRGLREAVAESGVEIGLGRVIDEASGSAAGFELRAGDERMHADHLIDASGDACAARLLGLPLQARGLQWGAQRSVLACDEAGDRALRAGLGSRTRVLRRIAAALATPAAATLDPLDDERRWLLTLDVPPGSRAAERAALAERAAAAIGARVIAQTWRCGERAGAAPVASLDIDELFAQRDRGLCWASWPLEEHRDGAVHWRYPPAERYGIPAAVLAPPGAPPGLSFIGKGGAVTAAAAAALRVTGTCLALGAVAGRLAAR